MGDRVYSTFEIGGLTQPQIDVILLEIDASGMSLLDSLGKVEDFILTNVEGFSPTEVDYTPTSFTFIEYEANNGDEHWNRAQTGELSLKAFCIKNKLPFYTSWGDGGDFEAGFSLWRPEFEDKIWTRGTSLSGVVTVDVQEWNTVKDLVFVLPAVDTLFTPIGSVNAELSDEKITMMNALMKLGL